jgi:hypothetical protein
MSADDGLGGLLESHIFANPPTLALWDSRFRCFIVSLFLSINRLDLRDNRLHLSAHKWSSFISCGLLLFDEKTAQADSSLSSTSFHCNIFSILPTNLSDKIIYMHKSFHSSDLLNRIFFDHKINVIDLCVAYFGPCKLIIVRCRLVVFYHHYASFIFFAR